MLSQIGAARRRDADRDRAQQEPGAFDGDLDAQGAERRGHRRAGPSAAMTRWSRAPSTIPARNSPSAALRRLVNRAEGDDDLATCIGLRPTIPRHLYLKLLAKASDTVRQRLEAANPQQAADVPTAVKEATRRARSRALGDHPANRDRACAGQVTV